MALPLAKIGGTAQRLAGNIPVHDGDPVLTEPI
ncbi:MAG: hypothetical protein K0S45_3122 [Nitrospira sp.]|nr:hypothetical protein [Nitrospira sp.]